ncbi:MAG: AraC family transcriptional regulator [Spirochaetota bacterium]
MKTPGSTWKASQFFRVAEFPVQAQRFGARSFTAHTHDFIQLVYVESGTLTHEVGSASFAMDTGDIMFVPPFVRHRPRTGTDVSFVQINFAPFVIHSSFTTHLSFMNSTETDAAYLAPLAHIMRGGKPRPVNLAHVHAVGGRISDMIERYASLTAFDAVLKADLLWLLAHIAETGNKEKGTAAVKHRDEIASAIRFIESKYADDIGLADAASAAALSPSFFSRSFRNVTGKTFVHYLAEVRIFHAVRMLRESSRPVTDICYAVGFNDMNHFCRMFKRMTGRTPSVFRKTSGL